MLSPHIYIVYGWLDGPNFTGDESDEPYPMAIGFIKGHDFGSGLVLSYSVEVTEGSAGKKTGHYIYMCIHKPSLLLIHRGGC